MPDYFAQQQKLKKNANATKTGGNQIGLLQPPPILAENGAKMDLTWLPKWSQDGQKNDPDINHIFDTSWRRSLGGCWWILGGKMQPS